MKLSNDERRSETREQFGMVTMIIRRRMPREFAARKSDRGSIRRAIRLRPSGNHPEPQKRLGS